MASELVRVLMDRDGMTEEEATKEVNRVRKELMERISEGEMPEDILQEEFGLEPDYLMDLL